MTFVNLPNVYVDILRSQYDVSGLTNVATPYLYKVEGHLTRIKDSTLMRLSYSGVKGTYEFYCDADLDVRMGDIIRNIIAKSTGLPWYEVTGTETWRVVDVTNSSPMFLEYKDVVIDRVVAGGPAPLG